MPTLERAIEMAAKYHAGQTDKGGQPYILHPLRVMASVTCMEYKIVAVLHDIVEDTPVTFEMLVTEGFAAEVVDAVHALTKRRGETRLQAAANPIARAVKLADVSDNMDISRLRTVTDADRACLAQYREVKALLEAA